MSTSALTVKPTLLTAWRVQVPLALPRLSFVSESWNEWKNFRRSLHPAQGPTSMRWHLSVCTLPRGAPQSYGGGGDARVQAYPTPPFKLGRPACGTLPPFRKRRNYRGTLKKGDRAFRPHPPFCFRAFPPEDPPPPPKLGPASHPPAPVGLWGSPYDARGCKMLS